MSRKNPAGGMVARQFTGSVPQLVERARGLARPGTRTILGITGAPGAGKSTITAALLGALGHLAADAPMDGYHLSNEVLRDLGRRQRKGAWDTFDVDGYVALLRRLRANEDKVVYAPTFDRSTETAIAAALPIPRAIPLVVTEGNYLLHDAGGWEKVRPLLTEVWFVDVPPAERVRRLIDRRTGDGEGREQAQAWVEDVDQANADVVLSSAIRADLLVSLTDADSGEPETRRAQGWDDDDVE